MDSAKRTVYEFGDFILEGGRRRLLRRGSDDALALTGKAFDTLLYLVEHRGETLDKDTLLRVIWPGVIVEENSLTQGISMLRQVLGEAPGENRYIATVPRKGYRFVAEVTEPSRGANWPSTGKIAAAPKRSLWLVWIGATAVVLVAVGAYLLQRGVGRGTPSAIHTLAVLPFKPLLPAERDESLELGMTESMIASIGAHGGLNVSPLSSVRRRGAIDQDPLGVGRALHTGSVLDGSLQHRGNQLQVSVRLLRVSDGRELWANHYEGNISSIFGIQEQISAKVAETLSGKSTAAGAATPQTVGGTRDAAAYLLYASGRYALARSTEESLALAIGYFEQALERDPRFALAQMGFAESYMILGIFGMRPPAETMPRARDAVLKALRIEPQLAGAYSTLGQIKLEYDRDWDGAASDFARAIELDPSQSEAHLRWGVLLGMRGELDRGLEELKQAQQLEPLLTLPKTRAGALLYFAHRYDEAFAQITESLVLDDRPGVAHALLGRVYLRTARYDLALAEFAKNPGPTPGSFGDVGQALALAGRRAEALAELDRVLKLSTRRYVPAGDIASIYASLGDTENALIWLDRALQQRAPVLGFLAQNPAFDGLHGDPRFAAIVDRIGIWKRPLAK
jgi:DNA-binding winged helix-turn-helix (wHTH) protein/TolB-like protein/Flp pilus assembly protein TadD